jgi:hypothetical protein
MNNSQPLISVPSKRYINKLDTLPCFEEGGFFVLMVGSQFYGFIPKDRKGEEMA